MDYGYSQRPLGVKGHRFKENMLPTDFVHRNVFFGFQEDARGIKDRHIIGVDNILWGSDYPHQESTFPRSREILEEVLADCTDEEKAKICGGNTERIYRLN
jgi:predicted TIM-barrel fold metal-dependent hydrolase